MPRLEWDGRVCTNPPEGWRIMIVPSRGIFYYQATQTLRGGKHGVETGAMHACANVATEAEARRACEAALLRLGVLEPEDDWVNAADVLLASVGSRDAEDRRRAVAAVARALAALEVEKGNELPVL